MLIGKGFFITYADMLPNEGQYPPGGPGTGHRDAVTFIGFLHFTCPRDAHAQRAGLCVAGVRGQGRGGQGRTTAALTRTTRNAMGHGMEQWMDGWKAACLLGWLARVPVSVSRISACLFVSCNLSRKKPPFMKRTMGRLWARWVSLFPYLCSTCMMCA